MDTRLEIFISSIMSFFLWKHHLNPHMLDSLPDDIIYKILNRTSSTPRRAMRLCMNWRLVNITNRILLSRLDMINRHPCSSREFTHCPKCKLSSDIVRAPGLREDKCHRSYAFCELCMYEWYCDQ